MPCLRIWRAGAGRARQSPTRPGGGGRELCRIVTADRFVTDLSDQDALNRVWAEYIGETRPTTTVQVVRLATDPRYLVEINAIAVID
jgi:enamine deaminase RidA (YjgF/YER057c/UK114 family)